MKNYTLYISMLLVLFSCNENKIVTEEPEFEPTDTIITEKVEVKEIVISDLELSLIKSGLIDVTEIDSTFLIDIKYSSTDNFVGEDMYGDFDKAYLQKDVAQKLANAQIYLKELNPDLSLLIYDAVRPRHIQQKMWDALNMPFSEKVKFISNPKNGSLHNFGAAVDVTLANTNGEALAMGTPYDFIGELAYPTQEAKLLKSGALTQEIIDNRKLLRQVMKHGGFFGIQTEWWHFNSCRRAKARELYQIVE